MLNNSKFISYNKKSAYNKSLEKKNNKSGRNCSGKIVIRFKSKSNIKKQIAHDLFNKFRTLDFATFNRLISSRKSLYSSYILKKDIIYPLGILVKNFSHQILRKKVNNFIYFFKRLFFSKELYLKINLTHILTLIKSRLEFFYNICLEKLHVGQIIKKLDRTSKKEQQVLDSNLIKNFHGNNLICNVNYSNKRLFVSPLTKGLILHISSKNSLILTPKKKIIKLPLNSTAQLLGNAYLRKSKCAYKKASNFKFSRSKPRVLGKSMNICDHFNGGYKRSSKLLRNFKSKLIKK